MQSSNPRKIALLISSLLFSGAAWAITPAEEPLKECKKPKFRDFVPSHQSEVAPETEISFHVSRGSDPASVTAEAKKLPMKVSVTDKVTFLYVTAKLPPELREGFARIHVTANAVEGGCLGQDGWLIKIKDADSVTEAPANAGQNAAE